MLPGKSSRASTRLLGSDKVVSLSVSKQALLLSSWAT